MQLVKCERYRKFSGPLIFRTSYEAIPKISDKSFEENRISKWKLTIVIILRWELVNNNII